MKGIKNTINKLYSISLFTSVVILALGIFLFIRPGTVIDIIAIVVGILFLIPGITELVDYFKNRNQSSLITGIITVLVAIILMAYRNLIASVLPFIFGIFFVVNGINRLQYVSQVRKEFGLQDSKPFFMAILITVTGIIFIIYPLTVAKTAFQVMGLFLCVYAILDIVNTVVVKKEVTNINKNMKNAIIEIEAKEKDD